MPAFTVVWPSEPVRRQGRSSHRAISDQRPCARARRQIIALVMLSFAPLGGRNWHGSQSSAPAQIAINPEQAPLNPGSAGLQDSNGGNGGNGDNGTAGNPGTGALPGREG